MRIAVQDAARPVAEPGGYRIVEPQLLPCDLVLLGGRAGADGRGRRVTRHRFHQEERADRGEYDDDDRVQTAFANEPEHVVRPFDSVTA